MEPRDTQPHPDNVSKVKFKDLVLITIRQELCKKSVHTLVSTDDKIDIQKHGGSSNSLAPKLNYNIDFILKKK